MYNVSNGYLTAFRKPVHRWKIRGTVGNVAFTDSNILTGSFHLSNACSGNDDITLGMANIGQLSATFVGLNIQKTKWKNKDVYVEIGLTKSGGQVEYVPVGTYRITSAEHSAEGVTVEAYDNMRLFDKPFAMMIGPVNAYDLLQYACTQCGVTFGMDNLNGFCNKNLIYPPTYEQDIETYRDLIYWVAQTQCAFATIDRDGALVLRRFVSAPVDTIDADSRYNTSRFADYTTKYTGISVVNVDDNTTKYYHLTSDDGTTINLGQNPMLQRTEGERAAIINNMLAEVSQIQYTPFTATMLGGIQYDLGDVLTESGGIGDNATCLVTGYDYNYKVGYEMTGVGANPLLATAQSKSDKNIQALLYSTNKNEYRDYELKNANLIRIGSDEEARICMVRLASNNSTKALIHLEINLESIADSIADDIDVDVAAELDPQTEEITASGTASGDDIFRLVSDNETKGIVRYLVNSVETPFKPCEQWTDGKHVLHLMYVLPLTQGITAQFEVYMRAVGGTLEIPADGLWFYGSGRGLVGDGKWDGSIEVQEYAPDWQLIEIGFESAEENMDVSLLVPIGIVLTDNAAEWQLQEISFNNTAENMTINLYAAKYGLITEDEQTFITEDGNVYVTEWN
jgi:hypothetical protein